MSPPMVPALRKVPPLPSPVLSSASPPQPALSPAPADVATDRPASWQRRRVLASAAALGAGLSGGARAQAAPPVPAGYPAGYAEIIARALQEGTVNVHASTDAEMAQPLVAAFEARYPGLKVRYQDLNT